MLIFAGCLYVFVWVLFLSAAFIDPLSNAFDFVTDVAMFCIFALAACGLLTMIAAVFV